MTAGGTAARAGPGRSLKDERIVEAKMAEYASELDGKIGAAAEKIVQHNQERHLYVKQEIKDALFGMEHVVSAAYVPLKPDYWELYVIHDGDCTAKITKQLIDKIVSGGSSVRASPRPENHARVKDGAHARRRRADL